MFGMANRLYTIAYSHTEKVNMTAAVNKKEHTIVRFICETRTVTVYTWFIVQKFPMTSSPSTGRVDCVYIGGELFCLSVKP